MPKDTIPRRTWPEMEAEAMSHPSELADYERGIYPPGKSRAETAWFLCFGVWPVAPLPWSVPDDDPLWEVMGQSIYSAAQKVKQNKTTIKARQAFQGQHLFRVLPRRFH